MLACLEDPDLDLMLSSSQNDSEIHLMPLQDISPRNIAMYTKKLQVTFDHVIAFRPTGWTFRPEKSEKSTVQRERDYLVDNLKPSVAARKMTIYDLPYSEHSSFSELAAFVSSLKIAKLVPTVGTSDSKARAIAQHWFHEWQKGGALSF